MPIHFKLSEKRIEERLEDMYSLMLSQLPTGLTLKQARAEVKRAINFCKREAGKERDNLSNCGDLLLKAAKSGVPGAKKRVEEARKEGATDDDIKEYWNLHCLERRMVIWAENVFCFLQFTILKEEDGLSPEDASNKIRKMLPIYGDSNDTKYNFVSNNDQPLPNELRARVDIHRKKYGAEIIQIKVSKYSSYDAFVRAEIKKGNL